MNNIWRSMGNVSKRTKVALMLLLAVSAMGCTEKEDNTDEAEHIDKIEIQKTAVPTYGEYMARLRPLEPMIIADLIAKEGVRVNAQGLHVPYKDSRGKWTIGFGSTVLKDGSQVTEHTKPITTEEAYELARWHLEHETFLLMYWYDIAHDKVNINTTEEAFAIASIMYNAYANLIEKPSKKDKKGKYIFRNVNYDTRSALLRKDFDKYGAELPASVVLKRFEEYPITHMESFGRAWLGGESKEKIANSIGNFLAAGRGIWWRRWLEAETFLGNVKPEMMLNCPVNGMYEFFRYAGEDKSNWFEEKSGRRVNDKTLAKFQEWIQAPRQKGGASLSAWKKSKDWLPPHARQMCEQGKCKIGGADKTVTLEDIIQLPIKVQSNNTEYDRLHDDAISEYKKGDYKNAADKLEKLIKKYPQNAALRNDLAATYNKLGRYDDAIAQCHAIIKDIGEASQLGAAYFNAGVAREKKGDVEMALSNYKLAVKNGNGAAKSSVNRLAQKNKSSQGKTKAKGFKKGAKKVTQKKESGKSLAPYIIGKGMGNKK